MAKARGFSLIELMIAVAIVGILVAIAVPSYQNHLMKGRRAEAQAFVTQVAQKQQQYLMDARSYALGASALTTLGLTPPTTVSNYYTVTVEPDAATTPPSFTVRATPSGVQVKDGVMTLTHTGAKSRVVPGPPAGEKGW